MGLFDNLKKSEEDKFNEAKNTILSTKEFEGKIGQKHQGLNTLGLWGVMDNGKTKFKFTKFKIYDDKILIERNRTFINLSEIKEIFQEKEYEAIIILHNGDEIPIQGINDRNSGCRELKAFLEIISDLTRDIEPQFVTDESNKINNENETLQKSNDDISSLIQLGNMYEKGLLTDEEFAAMKKKLIEGD